MLISNIGDTKKRKKFHTNKIGIDGKCLNYLSNMSDCRHKIIFKY